MVTKKGGDGRRRASTGWRAARASAPFAGRSGAEFSEVITDLLFTELSATGLSTGRLHAYVESNKGDGGVDAYLDEAPRRPTRLLTGPAVFQFKSACPASTKLFAELKSPAQERARNLLSSGADYVLVVGSDVPAEKVARALGAGLRRLIPKWRGKARVVDAAELLDLLRQSTATWRRFAPGLHTTTLRSWTDWAALSRFDTRALPWVPDKARQRQCTEFREACATTRREWRFVGPPGVGKSRFVLELTRDIGRQVLVAEQWSPSLHELAKLRVGWLVVDECTSEQHLELVEMLRKTEVRLITIGRDDRTDAVDAVRLAPLEEADARQLVSPALPEPVRNLIAARSGGYPKLLRLYALSALKSPERIPQSTEDLHRALRAFLEVEFPLPQEALELWALPSVASQVDIERLAQHEGFGVNQVAIGKARAFLETQGLLGTFGDPPRTLHYVTPLLFADWLASELWKSPSVVLDALEKAAPELRHACIRRLVQGDSTLRQRLAEHLDRISQLLGPAALAEVAQTLAATSPQAVLELIRRLLHATPHREVIRSATWALRTVAWFPATFDEAVAALVPLVDETNTSSFVSDLFGTHLGTTCADGAQRLRVLRHLAESARPLALLAATEACAFEVSRGSGGLPAALRENWHPQSRDEELAYVSEAARVFGAMLSPAESHLALRSIRELFRRGLGEAAAPLVDAWTRLGLPMAELLARFELIVEHDLAELGERRAEQEEILRQFSAHLPSLTLTDRIAKLVSNDAWLSRTADEPLPNSLELAAELVGSAEAFRSLPAVGGPGLFEFGRLCARRDVERRLVQPVVKLGRGSSASQFAVGYFFEWPASDVDAALREWVREPSLVGFAFSLLHRLGGNATRAELLSSLIRSGALAPSRLGELYFGAWLRGVGEPHALALLELAPQPARFLMAAQRFEQSSTARRVAVEAWFEIDAGQLDGMVEDVWLEVAAEARAMDPRRFAEAMTQRLEEAGDSYTATDVLARAVSEWLKADPSSLSALLDRLTDGATMAPLRGLLVSVSNELLEVATEWAKRHAEHAHAMAPLSSGADELALRLLEVADGPLVRRALAARAGSVAGWGDLSALVTARAGELARLSKRAYSPGVRRWFAAQSEHLARVAEKRRREEAAERAGALPLPFVAEGER